MPLPRINEDRNLSCGIDYGEELISTFNYDDEGSDRENCQEITSHIAASSGPQS